MGTPWSEQVVAATSTVVDSLQPLEGLGWDARAGQLEWTCHQTSVHVASNLVKYAAQLAGHTDATYLRFELTMSGAEPPAELLRVLRSCGLVLAAVVDGSPSDARAWHWGPTDAAGFAAMGIGEMLVHTYDITRGLGHRWWPPGDLAASVVSRLDLGASEVDDPSARLLWSTGRIDIDGLDCADGWVWRAARERLSRRRRRPGRPRRDP